MNSIQNRCMHGVVDDVVDGVDDGCGGHNNSLKKKVSPRRCGADTLGLLILYRFADCFQRVKAFHLFRWFGKVENIRHFSLIKHTKFIDQHLKCSIGFCVWATVDYFAILFMDFNGFLALMINRSKTIGSRITRSIGRCLDEVERILRETDFLIHKFLCFVSPINSTGVGDGCQPRTSKKLYHIAERRNQFDNVPSYPVAWAGFSLGSRAWRELRARATTWLNRRESSSTVGVAVPFCHSAKVAGVTPKSWAMRAAGVLESSRAPAMSKKQLFLDSILTFRESLINFSYVVVLNNYYKKLKK